MRRVDLVGIDDRILESAGTLEPRIVRTLDAIHLATAMTLGDDLDSIVTYDQRMARQRDFWDYRRSRRTDR